MVMLLVVGCSDEENPLEPGEKMVTAAKGGTITAENGVSLIIPSGALKNDTAIKATSAAGSEFDEFCVIGARFEPDGLTFLKPATIRFPMPADWPAISDPSFTRHRGRIRRTFPGRDLAVITGSAGKYVAEVQVSHFTSFGAARNCHAGTLNYLLNKFAHSGCSTSEVVRQVNDRYGNRFEIKNWQGRSDQFWVDNSSMQYFLETYFDNLRGYEEWEAVDDELIDTMLGYLILYRKQVVVAFSTKWNVNNSALYDDFAHTAALEVRNGQLKLRQSVSVNDGIFNQLVAKNGENAFWYPKEGSLTAELLNQFRQLKTGVGLEEEFCGAPGCLWPNRPLEGRIQPWTSVRFYVPKNSDDENPCTVNDFCTRFAYPDSPEEYLFDEKFSE
jgi:hypothetical protein